MAGIVKTRAFGFEEDDDVEKGDPKTIEDIKPLSAFVVKFRDGQSRLNVRTVFHSPGTDFILMIQPSAGDDAVLSAASAWFQQAFLEKMRGSPAQDGVTQV